MSVDHYENFPVASILCPPALRPAVVALYHFARTADDIADEGPASPDQRRALLQRYRRDLEKSLAGQPEDTGWPQVFAPLQRAARQHALPARPLEDLLDAFEHDLDNPAYPDRAALLAYCTRSANPIGRLLLHLYGVHDAGAIARSDDICTALQLINFWQDFSRDHPRGRCYIPQEDARRHGLDCASLTTMRDSAASQALVADLVAWARGLMRRGSPLALELPGRAGWELRLVVQGGLRILEKIEALDGRTLSRRPQLSALDMPLMVWRALRMRKAAPAASVEPQHPEPPAAPAAQPTRQAAAAQAPGSLPAP